MGLHNGAFQRDDELVSLSFIVISGQITKLQPPGTREHELKYYPFLISANNFFLKFCLMIQCGSSSNSRTIEHRRENSDLVSILIINRLQSQYNELCRFRPDPIANLVGRSQRKLPRKEPTALLQ
mmetsp:Transcript_23641/g.50597  ORF Transcript_23641/g.50597 Transcript_23641/m.50597 type:complete len:125 (+) Transcript_23641:286-660(+)